MRTWMLTAGVCGLCMIGQGSQKAEGAAIIIDHTSVVQAGAIPQSAIDKAAADLTFYFAHASVGIGMYEGLQALHQVDPVRYPLDVLSTNGGPAPATVARGKVYENNRGNPAWQTKVDGFAAQLASGWGTKANVVLNKFCYIDVAAEPDYYAISNARNSAMSQLEVVYPGTTFVYMTMPVTIIDPLDPNSTWFNIWRNEFNDQLRTWAKANGKVLFDVADIEAWSPAGVQSTFVYGGQTYQSLAAEYSLDGQHHNSLGSQRLALGFYALGAALVPEPGVLLLAASTSLFLLMRSPVPRDGR